MNTGKTTDSDRDGQKRVCVFTGASGKLGSAFCRLYASQYQIAAVYHKKPLEVPTHLDQLIDPLEPGLDVPENDHRVFAIQADLMKERELERVIELVLARFNRIDLLVNAAVYSIWASLIASDPLFESLEQQFHLNTIVPLKLAILAARCFWRDRYQENIQFNRNVVNVTSISGVRAYVGRGQSIYGATKAALNHLTRHMASEFRPIGVRVNATAPNSFPTIIPTESAVQSIIHLDQGRMNGKILVLDRTGESLV